MNVLTGKRESIYVDHVYTYERWEYTDGSGRWMKATDGAMHSTLKLDQIVKLEEEYQKSIKSTGKRCKCPLTAEDEQKCSCWQHHKQSLTKAQPSSQYLQALEVLEQENQRYSVGVNGNVFVSTRNGLVTILLKADGTYEVDTEFK